jgi:type VI secretion system protein ImpG
MNPKLVEYYNRELAYLRELGAEFSAAFPKIAGRLSLREIEVADPYVERLLEGFSFLTARIQMKMDAEFPRLSQRILEMVCPHYLAPTPSMVVVRMEPSTTEGNLADGYRLPAGSVLRARKTTEEQTPCDFRTGHDVTLWPIDLVRARLAGPPLDLPLPRLRLPAEPAGHLRLELAVRGGMQFQHLKMDRLDVYISAVDAVASHLQELIHESLIGVVVHDAKDPSRVFANLPPEALHAEGYEQAQALLPTRTVPSKATACCTSILRSRRAFVSSRSVGWRPLWPKRRGKRWQSRCCCARPSPVWSRRLISTSSCCTACPPSICSSVWPTASTWHPT